MNRKQSSRKNKIAKTNHHLFENDSLLFNSTQLKLGVYVISNEHRESNKGGPNACVRACMCVEWFYTHVVFFVYILQILN